MTADPEPEYSFTSKKFAPLFAASVIKSLRASSVVAFFEIDRPSTLLINTQSLSAGFRETFTFSSFGKFESDEQDRSKKEDKIKKIGE